VLAGGACDVPLGVRQRLQLAVAVLHKPEILILDEPTSGVDPVARDQVWQFLADLSRNDGVTIFLSTHFMNEAARCDRISLMHAGNGAVYLQSIIAREVLAFAQRSEATSPLPITPAELILAKIWANGLVIVVAALLSLWLVVQWLLAVPIPLFIAGAVVYQFSVAALGILLATFTRSMPQIGLLAMPVLIAGISGAFLSAALLRLRAAIVTSQ